MGIKITFEFNSLAEAQAFINGGVSAAPGVPATPAAQAAVAPAPAPANPMPAPPTSGGVPPMPANGAGVQPSGQAAPQAANGASPSNGQWTKEAVAPTMQAFVKQFGPATLKQAFSNKGLPPALSQLDATGLATMHDYMTRSIAANQLLAS